MAIFSKISGAMFCSSFLEETPAPPQGLKGGSVGFLNYFLSTALAENNLSPVLVCGKPTAWILTVATLFNKRQVGRIVIILELV